MYYYHLFSLFPRLFFIYLFLEIFFFYAIIELPPGCLILIGTISVQVLITLRWQRYTWIRSRKIYSMYNFTLVVYTVYIEA